ncbi:hypothetical protein QR680_016937 [Steinernema hermaphroditum]|uniref:Uncharacterized protein n=1 Tax=Steinernema hermaphroditum TaxID=289476 RepID=A0AA39HF72_9BILA|nr:hypothetical protein QR680_016937 [Steinernema hermaphroditum]
MLLRLRFSLFFPAHRRSTAPICIILEYSPSSKGPIDRLLLLVSNSRKGPTRRGKPIGTVDIRQIIAWILNTQKS